MKRTEIKVGERYLFARGGDWIESPYGVRAVQVLDGRRWTEAPGWGTRTRQTFTLEHEGITWESDRARLVDGTRKGQQALFVVARVIECPTLRALGLATPSIGEIALVPTGRLRAPLDEALELMTKARAERDAARAALAAQTREARERRDAIDERIRSLGLPLPPVERHAMVNLPLVTLEAMLDRLEDQAVEHGKPHSRACGIVRHEHGTACSDNCPTCQGRPMPKAAFGL